MSTTAVTPRLDRFAQVISFGSPGVLTVILSLIAGGLQVVNQLVLNSGSLLQWRDIITMFLTFLAALGVQPLVGAAFRTGLFNLVHIPVIVTVILGAAVSALAGGLDILAMSTTVHTIIATVLTVLAGLGFGSVPIPAPAPAPPFPPPPAPVGSVPGQRLP